MGELKVPVWLAIGNGPTFMVGEVVGTAEVLTGEADLAELLASLKLQVELRNQEARS